MTTTPQHDDARGTLGRRTLLRRAGTAVAVAGGAAAVAAATSGTAEAATGDPVLAGQPNAAAAGTSLTGSSSAQASLLLGNSSAVRAPLALVDSGSSLGGANVAMEAGSLFNSAGQLYYVNDPSLASQALVHTDVTANQVIPIAPVRMLDTRSPAGISHVADQTKLDSLHRIPAGGWIELKLASLALWADTAFVNAAVTQTSAGGYITLAPAPTAAGVRPTTSSLTFGAGATVSNSAVVPLDGNLSLFIYALVATHVIIDVVALNSSPLAVTADAPFALSANARIQKRQQALAAASAMRAAAR